MNVLKSAKRIFTFLPKGCSVENINNFTEGLIPTLPNRISKISPKTYLAWKIKEFLERDTKHIVLFENYCMKKIDVFNYKDKILNAIFVNDEVYNYIDFRDTSIEKIEEIIRLTSALPTHIGILTSLEDATFILNDKNEYSEKMLQLLANNCKQLVVGAYDGESFVVCELSPTPK